MRRHCCDDHYQSVLQVKKRKRMAALDPSSRIFTTFQGSLKLHKDSIPGLMNKDCSATFKFLPPCWNELLRSNHLPFFSIPVLK